MCLQDADRLDEGLHATLLQHEVVPFIWRVGHLRVDCHHRESVIVLRLLLTLSALLLGIGGTRGTAAATVTVKVATLIVEELQKLLRAA